MTRHYSPSSDMEGMAGGAAAIAIVVLVIIAFVVIKVVVYIVKTFATYHEHKALWVSLSIWGGCCLLTILCAELHLQSPFPELAVASFIALLITCVVVDLQNRDTLLREDVNLIEEVIHTPWWK